MAHHGAPARSLPGNYASRTKRLTGMANVATVIRNVPDYRDSSKGWCAIASAGNRLERYKAGGRGQ